MKRWPAVIAAGFLALLVAAEIGLRIFIGDRPLFRPHPTIEYENAPNQSLHYRGALIETNSLGLRNPEIADKPADVMRVAVFGDSVVFGHINTDQADLATTLLAKERAPDGRRIETLNIAGNSWGPGNMLAWLDVHGDMSADAAIIVLSTHDLTDDRTFAPLSARFQPTSRMPLALLDLAARYIGPPTPIVGAPTASMAGDAQRSLPLLLERLNALPQGACLIIHEERGERASVALSTGAADLLALAATQAVRAIETRTTITSDGFSDYIHLTAKGQRQLADAMRACPALAGSTSPAPPTP